MKKVLIVSTQHQAPEHSDRRKVIEHLAGAIRTKMVSVDTVLFEDLIYIIQDNKPAIYDLHRGVFIDVFDVVYIKNWRAQKDPAIALAKYMQHLGVKVLTSELEYDAPTSKLSEGFILALNGLPYPDTVASVESSQLISYLSKAKIDYPAVLKAVDGSAGSDNYLVKSLSDIKQIVEENPSIQFMLQPFIQNEGDHRIIMLGYEPVLSFFRSATNGSHMNNTSQGGSAKLTDLASYAPAILDQCRLAARILKREIAGVDVLYDSVNGKHVILEVNSSPQLSSGAFLKEKEVVFARYIESLLA